MTDPVQIAVIGAVASTIVGVFNGFVILKLHTQSKSNGEKIGVVVEQTNGIHAKLLESEKKLSHSEGIAEGREIEKRENGTHT